MVKNQVNLAFTSKIKSNKDVTFLVVSLLVSAASLYFLVGSAYTKESALYAENATKEKDLQSKQELLANIKAFNEENKDMSVDPEKLAAFISNRNNYEDYFFHLKELARQSNLEITSMELQSSGSGESAAASAAPASGDAAATDAAAGTDGAGSASVEGVVSQLREQYINLSLRGNFDNIEYFYKALENGIPFIQEVSSDLSRSQKSGGSEGGEGQDMNPVLESKMSLKFNYY